MTASVTDTQSQKRGLLNTVRLRRWEDRLRLPVRPQVRHRPLITSPAS